MYVYMCAVLCLVAQLCLTLWDLMDCSPPGSSVNGVSPGKNTRVGCHALLQGIFPNQGLNSGLPHAGGFFTLWAIREVQEYWSGYPIPSPGELLTQELNWGLLLCRWVIYQLSYQGRLYMAMHAHKGIITHIFCNLNYSSSNMLGKSLQISRVKSLHLWLPNILTLLADI